MKIQQRVKYQSDVAKSVENSKNAAKTLAASFADIGMAASLAKLTRGKK